MPKFSFEYRGEDRFLFEATKSQKRHGDRPNELREVGNEAETRTKASSLNDEVLFCMNLIFYADDAGFIFGSREHLIEGSKIIYEVFL